LEEITELIHRIQHGDMDGFKTLYSRYANRILNFIYRLTGKREDAEDITQDVFLIVFNRLQELKEADRFDSWLYRIARNEVYQRLRKRKGSELSIHDEDSGVGHQLIAESVESDPLVTVLQTELGSEIQKVLHSLPFKMKEVFILSVIEQRSYEEITNIVGRSLLSVKTDIHRARVLAREKLKKYIEKKM